MSDMGQTPGQKQWRDALPDRPLSLEEFTAGTRTRDALEDLYTTDSIPLSLSVEEAATILRISRGSAYEGVRCGEIPSIKIGRTIRVPRSRLLRLLGEIEPTEAGSG